MKAMIFAAGVGSRLAPFTNYNPKALVEVGGKPMLQRVLENVKAAGITEVVVNIHHFAYKITDFLKANANFGLNITVSDESGLLLDTGGGLLKARKMLADEPVLLHNADILTDLPLRSMIEAHRKSGADVSLLCSRRTSSRTLYFSADSGRLCGWQNLTTGQTKPVGFEVTDGMEGTPFGGVHIVNPSVFPLLEAYARELAKAEKKPVGEIPFSIIPFYLSVLSQIDIRRFMLPEGCRWFDVGSPAKLEAARASLLADGPDVG